MSATINELTRRTDALAPEGGPTEQPDPLQMQALREAWITWEKDTDGWTPEQIIADPRYRKYEQRYYAALVKPRGGTHERH